jgi:hypothetical protein
MSTGPTRSIAIPPGRLLPWVDNFHARHGDITALVSDDVLRLTATDGAEASIAVPFPPWTPSGDDPVADLVPHLAVPRRVGAVLVRKGGHAVGVFDGPRLVASKVGSSYVQGKTKAGGWSQQRYARRRDNQSKHAYDDAAEAVVKILLPPLESLVAVATGGDKVALAAVFEDPRLDQLSGMLLPEVHPVPDPRLRVLQAFPDQFLALRIELNHLA